MVGSIRVVFDATGAIVGRMDYGPFGEELFGGTNLPDRRFAGLFRDGEAGLDAAGARSYQVRTGRFSTVDPVYAGLFEPQRWNRYAYALNAPGNLVDPLGLDPQQKKDPKLCTATIVAMNSNDWHCTATRGGGTWSPFSTPHVTTGMGPALPGIGSRGGNGGNGRRRDARIGQVQNSQGTAEAGNSPDYSGVTIVLGIEGSAVAGFGPEASTGIVVGPSGCPEGGVAVGGFGSVSESAGVNVSAGAFVGFSRGPVRNVGGVTTQVNMTFAALVNITLVFDSHSLLGASLGFGAGLPTPFLVSAGVTGTGMKTVGACR